MAGSVLNRMMVILGGVTDFRLMTKKDGGASKGCGFLELDTFACYEVMIWLSQK